MLFTRNISLGVACNSKFLFKRSLFWRLCSNIVSSDIKGYDQLIKVRNIGISAHIDAGKTTLTERLLFFCGRINEMHEVKGKDKVGATMDFMQLERERGITIKSAATYITWKDHHINIIDTPGHVDFTIEVERSLRVLDGAILVICASSGVQSQTLTVNRQLNRYNVPFIVFINKIDKQNSDHIKAFTDLKSKLGYNAALMHIPIGLKNQNIGLIDVISQKAFKYVGEFCLDSQEIELPAEYKDELVLRRQQLIESLSNVDDDIAELFISDKQPTEEQLMMSVRKTVNQRKFVAVFLGSALRNKGIQQILDSVLYYLPNPMEVKNFAHNIETGDKIELKTEQSGKNPVVALAFKLEAGRYGQLTYMRMYQGEVKKSDILVNSRSKEKVRIPRLVRVHANQMEDISNVYSGDICAFFGVDCFSGDTFIRENDVPVACESIHIPSPVLSLSLEPRNTIDMMKIVKAMKRFSKEDPTFTFHTDDETKELIISGMGELHLEIYIQRLELEYDCVVTTGKPRVSFRETLLGKHEFNYLHKKQSGGAGQFARIIGRVEALPVEQFGSLVYEDHTTGGVLTRNFSLGIKKNFLAFCEASPMTGQKISGIKLIINNVETHLVDTNEQAFRNAVIGMLREIFISTNIMVKEPIMKVEISYPVEYHTLVMHDLAKKIADIVETTCNDVYFTVTTRIPLNNLFGYTGTLRQLTQGKGEFTMEFDNYEPCTDELRDQLISQYSSYADMSL